MKVLWLAAALSAGISGSAWAADLTAYTTEWMPYNYEEGGKAKGISTDILRAACVEAKLDCEIKFVPWARAYKTVQHTRNTVLYTTVRRAERENSFLWVGPILPRTTWVYTRSNLDDKPARLQDLSRLRVGVVRGEASRFDLEKGGVSAEAIIPIPGNVDLLRMLLRSMIDAVVDTEVGMEWALRNAGASPQAVNRFMRLSDEGGYYFALNLESDPATVRRLQDAVDTLRRDGRLKALVGQYGVSGN